MMILFSVFTIIVVPFMVGTNSEDSQEAEWQNFKRTFDKSYTTPEEEERRHKIFVETLHENKEHNLNKFRNDMSYERGVNQFSDLNDEEFLRAVCCSKSNLPNPVVPEYISTDRQMVKDALDWRQIIYFPPIKNQGFCGSCWAFSAIGSIEAAINKAHPGKNVSLSEQCLIDCVADVDSQGVKSNNCKGRRLYDAFSYVRTNGIASNINYPYIDRQEQCKYDGTQSVGNISRWIGYPRYNENALKAAVSETGPASVHMKVTKLFRQYKSGIFNDKYNCRHVSENEITHSVVVIGYGSENGQDYWLIRNSWGAKWGEKGYMRLARNVGLTCGITHFGLLPIS